MNGAVSMLPFGAVIVLNNKLVAKGRNHVFPTFNSTLHAEMDAIQKAQKELLRIDLSDCVMYTSSKPCPMCEGAILWSNLMEVFYGSSSEEMICSSIPDQLFWEQMTLPENRKKFEYK